MLKIYLIRDKIFVWNAQDVITLRKEHHIVGALVGIYPIKPFQVQTKWLPLQLMPEEAKLLLNKGLAQLISSPKKLTDSVLTKSFFQQRDKLCKEQIVLLKENRKKIILEKADEIYEGKKRKHTETVTKVNKEKDESNLEGSVSSEKNSFEIITKKNGKVDSPEKMEIDSLSDSDTEKEVIGETNSELKKKCSEREINEEIAISSKELNDISSEVVESSIQHDELDKKAIIEAELAKVPEVSTELCMVQLFTECPWKKTSNVVDLRFPSTEKEKLRFAVFQDLWEKEYFITSGIKFGGDFLAYEGDPLKYHAVFIVVCLLNSSKIQANDIVMYGRLGHKVKKTVVFASFSDSGNIEYISVNWVSDM